MLRISVACADAAAGQTRVAAVAIGRSRRVRLNASRKLAAVEHSHAETLWLSQQSSPPKPSRRANAVQNVTLSFASGLVGAPLSSPYCPSKGGVRLFRKAVALECAAEGIRVNSVHLQDETRLLLDAAAVLAADGARLICLM